MINNMDSYFEFFETEDEAIDHCRARNRRGDLTYAMIDGPGCSNNEHLDGCECCAYAVVDLKTAKEILDYPDSGIPCLVVTD